MRFFALSDIHAEQKDNMAWIRNLSTTAYTGDTLLLAGDASHHPATFEEGLRRLRERFAHVFFVPGNHDLWLMENTRCRDSVERFHEVLRRCYALGIETRPRKVGGPDGAWVVPLCSWYVKPEEGEESLFITKKGEDPSLDVWSDEHFIRWPPFQDGMTAAEYFHRWNRTHLRNPFDGPVLTLSHFLPRKDLILSTAAEDEAAGGALPDLHQSFNFSRVAGSTGLERQLRSVGSKIHVYGHQHRNRHRLVDGVVYVSHCLGYKHEREAGLIRYLGAGPRQIWELDRKS